MAFINEVFPKDISFNSIGSTRFQTDVIMVDSGDDQRISRWSAPLMEYDVAYGVRTMEDLHALISFFRAMKGRLYGFLYEDHVDFSSTMAVAIDARAPPAISHLDQIIGTGDGSTKVFQLIKTYASPLGGATQTRLIIKPQTGTVLIAVNNVNASNFAVDPTTGLVTFSTPHGLSPLNNLTMTGSGTSWTINGAAAQLPGFNVGDRIVTNGWLNPLNNYLETDPCYVTSYASDRSTLVFNCANGKGAAEGSRNGVAIYVHPAPANGLTITAGYLFYVAVRFDTDRLPVSLEEYGIGGANDVKLIEVRPGEALS